MNRCIDREANHCDCANSPIETIRVSMADFNIVMGQNNGYRIISVYQPNNDRRKMFIEKMADNLLEWSAIEALA